MIGLWCLKLALILAGGNVGIGTTAPGTLLHVTAADPVLKVEATGTHSSSILNLHAPGQGLAKIQRAGTDVISISSNGNVGIGTTTPTATLNISHGALSLTEAVNGNADELLIQDDASAGISILTPNNETGWLVFGDTDDSSEGMIAYDHGTGLGAGADSMGFYTDGSRRMVINTSGNVGIGTASPLQILHLHASDTALRIADSSSSRSWDLHASSANKFHITDATRNIARITIMGSASGQVGIGTMWPSRTLDVGGGSDGMVLPVGTTAERPTTYLSGGTMRFNSSLNAFEGYTGSAWGSLGGGNAFDGASIIRYNNQTLSENVTVGTPGSLSANGFTAGPITIADSYTVTIEHGSNWTII